MRLVRRLVQVAIVCDIVEVAAVGSSAASVPSPQPSPHRVTNTEARRRAYYFAGRPRSVSSRGGPFRRLRRLVVG